MARAAGFLAEEPLPDTSWATSTAVRSVMKGNKSRDTKPEKRLRSILHREGLRYRVATRPLPELRRTADIVFPKLRLAVFVDGCYWHGCPDHYRPSDANREFWSAKIAANRNRDSETDRMLRDAGWNVIRVWEHEDPALAASRIIELVRSCVD
ncbi:very short patch repair endonuclease [Streptomyces sp. NPDC085946]|uniref:very short patch repair endonuclease n=1 Tax=Streptomyces sp. NPDC085946 TaxID=3365744 RepID=UPI0037D76161